MERLDTVCVPRHRPHQIPGNAGFTSDDYDMFQLVSLLRAGSFMVSSRYHGIVHLHARFCRLGCVTMDERIRNLMRERGHQHLFLTVDDPDLEPKLLQIMETLFAEAESVRRGHWPHRRPQSQKSWRAWEPFLKTPCAALTPNFHCAPAFFLGKSNLPPLSSNLIQLAERYDSSPVALAAAR